MASDSQPEQLRWRTWLPLALPLLVIGFPLLALLTAGLILVWQLDLLLPWLLLLLASGFVGYYALLWARNRIERALPIQQADPAWEERVAGAWTRVEERAQALTVADWPEQPVAIFEMARDVTVDISAHMHPSASNPLTEVSLPHALAVIEAASHDLRSEVLGVIPMAHRITLADLGRAHVLYEVFDRVSDWYRAGRLFANPASAIAGELNGLLRGKALDAVRTTLQLWLLRQWVRKVGKHAIALYSGQVLLSSPDSGPLSADTVEIARASQAAVEAEPLRLLILGRSGAGKSSLINALFETELAATDVVGSTTAELQSYVLERDGWPAAIVLDTPGCDDNSFGLKAVVEEASQADAILLVVPAIRADRDTEAQLLKNLRNSPMARERGLPPLFVVLSQIDRLHPPREWAPPYDLIRKNNRKSQAIAGAITAVGRDLPMDPSRIVPACLRPGSIYNVSDTLLSLIAEDLDVLRQARLRRCMATHRQREKWSLVRDQVFASGRLIRQLAQDQLSGKS